MENFLIFNLPSEMTFFQQILIFFKSIPLLFLLSQRTASALINAVRSILYYDDFDKNILVMKQGNLMTKNI